MLVRRSHLVTGLGCALALSAAAACNQDKGASARARSSGGASAATQAAYANTLYARLGGEKGIRLVVDDFTDRTLKNPKVNFTRRGTGEEWQPTRENVERFKQGLTAFLVERTGGPKAYRGQDMQQAHRGMQITPEEFAASADDLRASLRQLNVDRAAADELMAVVSRVRPSIVQQPSTRAS